MHKPSPKSIHAETTRLSRDADRQTDGRMDRWFSTLYNRLANVPALLCRSRRLLRH